MQAFVSVFILVFLSWIPHAKGVSFLFQFHVLERKFMINQKWFYFLILVFGMHPLDVAHALEPKPPLVLKFASIGDMPYTDEDQKLLQVPNGALLQALKQTNPAVLIHVGDFKKSSEPCTDDLLTSRYQQIAQLFPHRLVYTPGDNDWTDCDRLLVYDEVERLEKIKSLFFSQEGMTLTQDIPGLSHQKELFENSRWNLQGVAFATFHIPGTNGGRDEILRGDTKQTLALAEARDAANLLGLEQFFKESPSALALVIAFQADIYQSQPKNHRGPCTLNNPSECDGYFLFRERLQALAKTTSQPILVIHGDTSPYCFDQPFSPAPNLWRLNGPGDYLSHDIAQITFRQGSPTPFQVQGLLSGTAAPSSCVDNPKK